MSTQKDATPYRAHKAGNDIEQRGLAGAIRADQTEKLSFRHGKLNIAEHLEAPKSMTDVL
jgi:hypothetical protein